MFNEGIKSNPCFNCEERWIDIENMKRCHDTCDKHRNATLKNKLRQQAITELDATFIKSKRKQKWNLV